MVGSRASSNRRRILAVATEVLIQDPAASMDDIARAADVVRRTVYGHFPTRDALIAGIEQEADRELKEAFVASGDGQGPPLSALAHFIIALWPVGDRYRLLLDLATRRLAAHPEDDLLVPVRRRLAEILERGQESGDFSTHLPAVALSYALEALALGLLQAVNDDVWKSTTGAQDAALACLVAVGVPAERAQEVVTREEQARVERARVQAADQDGAAERG
ncbi:TetR/AcrR family transcriptional regulator [Sinosporangium siamense]|uniref:HTH tetR-type domain-containing protein n=1 Tax=Sinosporangium siamense TaxID=1367973 RepID=A0A919V793_9ACTN|nr:TetR/AcrR family transcriptional regulator [Sinosporangium siamense]GII94875.1 hypothetical protein Ssi02_51060 [Sinosporangium siamense]